MDDGARTPTAPAKLAQHWRNVSVTVVLRANHLIRDLTAKPSPASTAERRCSVDVVEELGGAFFLIPARQLRPASEPVADHIEVRAAAAPVGGPPCAIDQPPVPRRERAVV